MAAFLDDFIMVCDAPDGVLMCRACGEEVFKANDRNLGELINQASSHRCEERDEKVCVLCGRNFGEWGNNPEPLVPFDLGRCCNDCNTTKVIPARLIQQTSR
jgi:hypothetical protein